MFRILRVLGPVVIAAGGVAVGWWAGSVALQSPEDPVGVGDPVSYRVEVGTVGRALSFAAVAQWRLEAAGRNAAVGVVTSIGVEQGDVVEPGDVLFTVNLRPVVVAEGNVPAFRDLSLRDAGDDVAQLQGLLAGLGFYEGEVDGVFGVGVRDAVRAWQRSLGVADNAVVRRGDIVYVDGLPARVVLGEVVVVGAVLVGGEMVVSQVVGDVDFVILLSREQRGLVPLTADVEVTHDRGVWAGRIVEAREQAGEFGVVLALVLEAADGGSICEPDCASAVPLQGRTNFSARVIVVPEASGPVVPVAAIITEMDGSTMVHVEGRGMVHVTVVAAASGLAVVEGVDPGDTVLLPVSASR